MNRACAQEFHYHIGPGSVENIPPVENPFTHNCILSKQNQALFLGHGKTFNHSHIKSF